MAGEGPFSGATGPPGASDTFHEGEVLKAHLLLKQALHAVELSWRNEADHQSPLMTLSVSPVTASGGPPPVWRGRYTAAFLQQLTARTGSPLAPRCLWELLAAAVKAAEEDTKKAAGGPLGTEYAAAAGAFLNLWSAADLEALKRRGSAEGPQEAHGDLKPTDSSKMFLILTRAVEGRRVHYPLALTQKNAAAAAAAPDAAAATAAAAGGSASGPAAVASPSVAAESPSSCYRGAAAAAAGAANLELSPLQQQQLMQQQQLQQQQLMQTPRSVVSVGVFQETLGTLQVQQEQGQRLSFPQRGFAAACAPASDDDGSLRCAQQRAEGPPSRPVWGPLEAPQQQQQQLLLLQHRSVRSTASLSPSEPLLEGERFGAPGGTATATPTALQLGADAASELMRLRALVAEQQAALAEARRQNAARRQGLHSASLRGDSEDPQGLTAQLHRVEAELFMARQRLQTERQLRAREAQRFRVEIDKMRKTEASLRIRIRDLEAQLRSASCRQRRSYVPPSTAASPAVRSAAVSRSSSYDSHVAGRQREVSGSPQHPVATRGRARVSPFCGRAPGAPVYAKASPRAAASGNTSFHRAPTTPPQMSRSTLSSQGLRRGRSTSPFLNRATHQPSAARRYNAGEAECRSEGPAGVSASLLASTVSSRARERSNSIASCGSSSSICYSSNVQHPRATSSCACRRGRLMGSRSSQEGLRRDSPAHSVSRGPPQPDWRSSLLGGPLEPWGPPKQTPPGGPMCHHKYVVKCLPRCMAHSYRAPPQPASGGHSSSCAVSRGGVPSPSGSERAFKGVAAGGPWPHESCRVRGRSPFAAEARCEDDALLPPKGLQASQQQHQQQQQQPFVVLSALEYERLRSKGCATDTEAVKANNARPANPAAPLSALGENLVLSRLLPRPQQAESSTRPEARDKLELEVPNSSFMEGSSALTTVSDGASAEAIMHVAEEPSVSSISRLRDTPPKAPPVSHHSLVGSDSRQMEDAVERQTNLRGEDSHCPAKVTESIGTPKELKAGRAVFSEIDERLTALQKFLRSTRESFRLMETGSLGA